MFQRNRLAIDVAEIFQVPLERVQKCRIFFGVSRVPQNADARDSFTLLPAFSRRPPTTTPLRRPMNFRCLMRPRRTT
jgi:hypothetical protein